MLGITAMKRVFYKMLWIVNDAMPVTTVQAEVTPLDQLILHIWPNQAAGRVTPSVQSGIFAK